MLSLRAPARRPLPRLIARLLILVLVAGLLPADARASVPASAASLHLRTLPEIAATAPAAANEALVYVVVVAADPLWLTKTAFGEPLSHTGSDPQPYAFAGEPYDPNVGFQYHRARWMDPRVGRFASLDPFAGLDDDPPSLHEYAYGHDDPVDQRDPSGESIAGAALTGLTIGLALYSIADAVLDPEATTGTILFAAGVEIIPGSAYAKGGRLLAAKLGLKAMFRVWRAGRKFKGAIAHFAAAATTKEWKDVFFRAFPDLRGNVVVHHAVERDVANLYPHLKLDIYQLNCLENLRGIPKDANPSAHLSQIRLRWNDFYRRHEANPAAVTLQDLLEHARIIDDEFGHLFIPPWR